MVFRKQKMIDRVTAEGNADLLDDGVMEIMNNLDGCKVESYCWRRVVVGEPVYWVVGKDGNGQYVNENDCEEEWRSEHDK